MAEMGTLGSLRRFGIWSHPGGRSRQLVNPKNAFSRHEHACAPLPPDSIPVPPLAENAPPRPRFRSHRKKVGAFLGLDLKNLNLLRASVYWRTASRASSPLAAWGRGDARTRHIARRKARQPLRATWCFAGPAFALRSAPPPRRLAAPASASCGQSKDSSDRCGVFSEQLSPDRQCCKTAQFIVGPAQQFACELESTHAPGKRREQQRSHEPG